MLIDVLIVGQGLAGSLLAWEFMRQQVKVLVVDNGCENASQVAAGLINPVTGQRLVKSSEVDYLLPQALACYRHLAEQFGQDFFVPLPMLRILKNTREQHIVEQRLGDAAYQPFMQSYDKTVAGIDAPYGLLAQSQTGYLRTRPLLEALRVFFSAQASYHRADFSYEELRLLPEGVRWRDWQARQIVFCEGVRAIDNPWFGGLPFQPAKGEILAGRAEGVLPDWILNFGHWLLPQQQGQFLSGATFEPGKTDTQPSEYARMQLLQGLARVCPGLREVEVMKHRVGVRPCTLDKQPFIGPHPKHRQLSIFNGFGAKGSLAVPWYARRFVAACKGLEPWPVAGFVQRYDETYFPA